MWFLKFLFVPLQILNTERTKMQYEKTYCVFSCGAFEHLLDEAVSNLFGDAFEDALNNTEVPKDYQI